MPFSGLASYGTPQFFGVCLAVGVLSDAINEMTKGLIELERMQQSLNLAKEVQQNLLPKSNLKVNGLDIYT